MKFHIARPLYRISSSSILLFGLLLVMVAPLLLYMADYLGMWRGVLPDRLVPDSLFTILIAPFSVLLLYELTLLAQSIAKTIAIFTRLQFEVVSLILVRECFKKLEEIRLDGVAWSTLLEPLILISGGLALYFIIELIERSQVRYDRNSKPDPAVLRRWKYRIARLCGIGIGLFAVYETVSWLCGGRPVWLGSAFIAEAFVVLIAGNVVQLIVSAAYTHAYEPLFEYSVLILASVMTMVVLLQPAALKVPIVVCMALFALATLYLHGYARGHTKPL